MVDFLHTYKLIIKLILVLCPANWKTWGDSCWFSSDSADSYDGAVEACRDMSAHSKLAAIYNEFENWFVKGMVFIVQLLYNFLILLLQMYKWATIRNRLVGSWDRF